MQMASPKEQSVAAHKSFSFLLGAKGQAWLTLVAVALLAVFPLAFSAPYVLHAGIIVLYYIVLALALEILAGFLGEVSFGQAGFVAIGAYAGALFALKVLAGHWYAFWASLPVAGVLAALAGLLVGIPALRIRGYYFFIITVGFGEVVRLIALNWSSLTGGPMGLRGIPSIHIGSHKIGSVGSYYVILALALLVYVVVRRIRASYVGRAMLAIRFDPMAATAAGVNTTRYKVLAFIISAFFSGMAGAFYAYFIGTIHPLGFSAFESILVAMMVLLGGQGTIYGPILGAIVISGAFELLRPAQEFRMLLIGAVMVHTMLLKPKGILGR